MKLESDICEARVAWSLIWLEATSLDVLSVFDGHFAFTTKVGQTKSLRWAEPEKKEHLKKNGNNGIKIDHRLFLIWKIRSVRDVKCLDMRHV